MNGKKPNVGHLRAFDCKYFVLNNGKEHLGKFDSKADEGIFLGYESNFSSYKIFNKRTLSVKSSVHVTFDESNLPKTEKGVSPDIDKLTEELEDLELNKDDEAVAEIEPAADEDVPTDTEGLPKERR